MFRILQPLKLLVVSRRVYAALAILTGSVFLLAGCAGYGSGKGSVSTPSAEAVLTVSSTSFNFQTVVVGQTVTKTLHLSNTGMKPLNLTGLSLADKQFVISGPSVPRVILPGMGLDYTLAFTPTTAGNASAAITIASNASNVVSSISLAGVGEKVIATVNVSPASISFGNMPLQSTTSKNVTLQNTGDVNITVSGVTVVGAGFGYSDLSPGYALSPNQSVTFQVWFHPTIKGAASGTVSILSANLSSPATMALAGDGVTSTSNPTPPAAVQHTVHLSWVASESAAVAGYRVYRSESANNGFQAITGSLVGGTDYDDSTVDSGTTYYYTVTAVSASGQESADSNDATAAVPTP